MHTIYDVSISLGLNDKYQCSISLTDSNRCARGTLFWLVVCNVVVIVDVVAFAVAAALAADRFVMTVGRVSFSYL